MQNDYLILYIDLIPVEMLGKDLVGYGLVLNLGLIGIFGVLLNQGRFLVTLLFFEISFVSLLVLFIIQGLLYSNVGGLIFAFLLLIVFGVESGIVLTVISLYFFVELKIGVERIRLKG